MTNGKVIIEIPYGRSKLIWETGELSDVQVYALKEEAPVVSQEEVIARSMRQPCGGITLEEMARGKSRAVVILSDHTRPVPSRLIVPMILQELRRGNPQIQITLLVATGCHRGTRPEELEKKLGREIVQRERILIHDGEDRESHVRVGRLSTGNVLEVDRAAAQADLIVAEGFIEPHFFAGFSGGRKSVLPGICSRDTIYFNHCSKMIGDSRARLGITFSNPIHEEMEEAAVMCGLAYIINVVLDSEKRVIASFAGEPIAAHRIGCGYLKERCTVKFRERADIVLVSNGGYPLDQNIYQTVKGLAAAEALGKDNAVFIMCAQCEDGIGGDEFFLQIAECRDAGELLEQIERTPPGETRADQWQCQIFARILKEHPVIFVTEPGLRSVVEQLKMTYKRTLEEAVKEAVRRKGGNAKIAVIPDGVSIIPCCDRDL